MYSCQLVLFLQKFDFWVCSQEKQQTCKLHSLLIVDKFINKPQCNQLQPCGTNNFPQCSQLQLYATNYRMLLTSLSLLRVITLYLPKQTAKYRKEYVNNVNTFSVQQMPIIHLSASVKEAILNADLKLSWINLTLLSVYHFDTNLRVSGEKGVFYGETPNLLKQCLLYSILHCKQYKYFQQEKNNYFCFCRNGYTVIDYELFFFRQRK